MGLFEALGYYLEVYTASCSRGRADLTSQREQKGFLRETGWEACQRGRGCDGVGGHVAEAEGWELGLCIAEESPPNSGALSGG